MAENEIDKLLNAIEIKQHQKISSIDDILNEIKIQTKETSNHLTDILLKLNSDKVNKYYFENEQKITGYTSFVEKRYGFEKGELVYLVYNTLVKAFRLYDESKNLSFEKFFYIKIHNEIKDSFRESYKRNEDLPFNDEIVIAYFDEYEEGILEQIKKYLSVEEFEIFSERAVKGELFKAIAEKNGFSESKTVRKYYKIIEKLQRFLKREGYV